MMTQAERIENSLMQERTFAHLCTAFAILALSIACIGLYGSMAYAVSRRTSEIGIRMALGAQGSGVVWMVMREVAGIDRRGTCHRFCVCANRHPCNQSYLFGVKFGDLSVIGWGAGLLIASSLLAGYAPARRASRVDPIMVLRHE